MLDYLNVILGTIYKCGTKTRQSVSSKIEVSALPNAFVVFRDFCQARMRGTPTVPLQSSNSNVRSYSGNGGHILS